MAPRATNRDRPSIRRRTVFGGLTLILVVLVVECACWVVLSVLQGRPVTWSRIEGHRNAVAGRDVPNEAAGPESAATDEVPPWAVGAREANHLHPFIGFVARPAADLAVTAPRFRPAAANYGFPHNFFDLIAEPSPEYVIVAVVGGSVAQQIGGHGRPFQLLDAALEATPRFRGRDVRVLNFALGGYKQPQQLMVLTYFLSLGAHFDVVVNLDGFNEVTLPIRDNIATGVNPFYPQGWRYRLGGDSPEELDARGAVVVIDGLRRSLVEAASKQPWRSSFTASLVWWLIDGRLNVEANRRQADLMSRDGGELSLELSGPRFQLGSADEICDAVVAHWRRCSEDIGKLSQAHGFEYYHFLQPNQYDEGSKRLTIEERRLAYDSESPFVGLVGEGYPRLRLAGPSLGGVGVDFTDLTRVFAEIDETVYIDTCCHLNRRGIQLIVDRMAEVVSNGNSAPADRR